MTRALVSLVTLLSFLAPASFAAGGKLVTADSFDCRVHARSFSVTVNAGGASSREDVLRALELMTSPGFSATTAAKTKLANDESEILFYLNFVEAADANPKVDKLAVLDALQNIQGTVVNCAAAEAKTVIVIRGE